jgi:hypothetical protein
VFTYLTSEPIIVAREIYDQFVEQGYAGPIQVLLAQEGRAYVA